MATISSQEGYGVGVVTDLTKTYSDPVTNIPIFTMIKILRNSSYATHVPTTGLIFPRGTK